MKVCGGCGETYHHRVDFCFRDGEILVAVTDDERASDGPRPAEFLSLSQDLVRPVSEPRPEPTPSGFGASAAVLAFLLLVPVLGGGLVIRSIVRANAASEVTAPLPEP